MKYILSVNNALYKSTAIYTINQARVIISIVMMYVAHSMPIVAKNTYVIKARYFIDPIIPPLFTLVGTRY